MTAPELVECVPVVNDSYLIDWNLELFTARILKIITIGGNITPVTSDIALVETTSTGVRRWVPVRNFNQGNFYKVKTG